MLGKKLTTCVYIIIIILPYFLQMVRLYKDPKGDKLFADMNRNMNSSESVRRTGTTAITALEDHTLKIQSLEKQVATLSSKLKVYKVCKNVTFTQYCNKMFSMAEANI